MTHRTDVPGGGSLVLVLCYDFDEVFSPLVLVADFRRLAAPTEPKLLAR